MSAPEDHPEAGLLRMLRAAVRTGLAPGADDEAFTMGRSAAQIVGLPGLDAALAALEPFRGPGWREPALGLVEHLERLVTEPTLAAIRKEDGALWTRAAALQLPPSVVDAEPPGVPAMPAAAVERPAGTLSVGSALLDLPLAGDRATAEAGEAWLTAGVATTLRSLLDFLPGEVERPRPLRLRSEDSLLEVRCEAVAPENLEFAHEVLAGIDGNLAPVGETSARAGGAWLVRVPTWSPRPVHLMVEQGPLRLAVPWHAVLRVSLVSALELEERGGSLATPVLPPLAPLASGVGERPVVAIAHGLKRGLLVADQLVWRLGASPCEPAEPPPAPGLTRAVCSDEGEVFWVAEPRVLLESVGLPVFAPTPRSPKPAPPRAEPPRTIVPLENHPVTLPGPAAVETEPLPELTADDVEPLVLEAADVEPLPAAREAVTPPATVEVAPAEVTASAPTIEAALPAAPTAPAPAAAEEPATVAASAEASSAPEAAVPLGAADLIAEPGHVLPEWLDRFGTAAGSIERHAAPPAAGAARPGAPRVLIAEDSIAASHFLARLFEQRGFETHVVDSAAGLRAALAEGAWSLACVDVELPDAAGREFLEETRARLEALELPVVALVRDDEDTELAAASGIRRVLRKPFDREELEHLLKRLTRLAGDPA